MESFKITKIKTNTSEAVEDFLAREVPLTILVNDRELVTLLCTPQDLEDLVTGFLFTSGLIKKGDGIKRIALDKERWIAYVDLASDTKIEELVFKRMYTSGCGTGTLFYNAVDFMHRSKTLSGFTIKSGYITRLMLDFQGKSEMYMKTGGSHSAAIGDNKGIAVFREDIGRHNALDKAIGHMIRKGISLEDKFLITSGRISSEVLFKAQKCKVPLVISKSAPTDQAVRLARQMGITLVGFARGNRMNVYSEEKRVVIEE